MTVGELRTILNTMRPDMLVFTEDGFRVTEVVGARVSLRTVPSVTVSHGSFEDVAIALLQSQ